MMQAVMMMQLVEVLAAEKKNHFNFVFQQ